MLKCKSLLLGLILAVAGATAMAQPYTLTLYVWGNGTISVDSPAGVYGPSKYTQISYTGGETVHLSVASGTLVQWQGDGTGTPVRTVVMTADRVVTAQLAGTDGNCDTDCSTPSGIPGQVNISGATLFVNFFSAPAGTNDWIDVNQDGVCGNQGINTQQLAEKNPCSFLPNHWVVNYRGVGSGNGLAELVNWHCNSTLPSTNPSDEGWTNRLQYSLLGGPQGGCPDVFFQCPVMWESVDIATSDVPSSWFFRQDGTGAWSKRPGQVGYGTNARTSTTGFSNMLNAAPPPACGTLFNNEVAWVPIAIIANHGTGLQNIKTSEGQYLWVTGRMPSGENLKAATRDKGSGTRNGSMNSCCIDPSYAIGDNTGSKFDVTGLELLGPNHQVNNCGGSGLMEDAVKNTQLAVGYTGLEGSSRAQGDAAKGQYEILNVINDLCGGTQAVRPNTTSVIHNSDPNTGYRIGGNETFISYGNPLESNPASPDYMTSQTAADYLRNILCSIRDAEQGGSTEFNMPGEFLANAYFLAATIDYLPNIPDCCFGPNPNLNTTLQQWVLDNHAGTTPGFGANGVLTPVRTNTVAYNDGAPVGALGYRNPFTGTYGQAISGTSYSLAYGLKLNPRNYISGDFDGNGSRSCDDIPALMAAIQNPVAWATAHSVATNPVVPEIIGDFNGDGNFDAKDVRYFADGLALVSGQLDRACGFTKVDCAWAALTGSANYFGTTLATGKPYRAGDSRGDVAGNAPWRGADPHGFDGTVDCADIAYVRANFGIWTNLDDASRIDLSGDMNGDLVVNEADVAVLIHDILGTEYGDLNLDGNVDATDLALLNGYIANPPASPTYCTGDLNGDGLVDATDLAILNQHLGYHGVRTVLGDMNCDGIVNNQDIDGFVQALFDGQGYVADHPSCNILNGDFTGDGLVNNQDIDGFIEALFHGGGDPCQ